LVNGFVANAHRLVAREVDQQASSNLLWAPGLGPAPIFSPAMSATLADQPSALAQLQQSAPLQQSFIGQLSGEIYSLLSTFNKHCAFGGSKLLLKEMPARISTVMRGSSLSRPINLMPSRGARP
jgi:hypothetical protein